MRPAWQKRRCDVRAAPRENARPLETLIGDSEHPDPLRPDLLRSAVGGTAVAGLRSAFAQLDRVERRLRLHHDLDERARADADRRLSTSLSELVDAIDCSATPSCTW